MCQHYSSNMKINIRANLSEEATAPVAVIQAVIPPATPTPAKDTLIGALMGARASLALEETDEAADYVDQAIELAADRAKEMTARAQPSSASATPSIKQSTRMLKYVDTATGYTVRLSAKWAAIGAPICPINNRPMVAA